MSSARAVHGELRALANVRDAAAAGRFFKTKPGEYRAGVKRGEFDDTLRLAEVLLHDPHDLIHKAVGWMLREVGNRSRAGEETFLRRYAGQIRPAIEQFPERVRRRYLAA